MTANQTTPSSPGEVKVLVIVEDDEDMRFMLKLLLRKERRLRLLGGTRAGQEDRDPLFCARP